MWTSRTDWADKGCASLRTDSISVHLKSECHKQSVLFAAKQAQNATPAVKAIVEHFEELKEKDRGAVIKRLKLVYFLAKHELANSLFADFFELVKGLDAPGLDTSGVQYVSHSFVSDALAALSGWLGQTFVFEPARQADGIGIMLDETCDVSVKKQLIVWLRLVKSGEVVTRFGGLLDLRSGRSRAIFNAAVSFLAGHGININRVFGIATDGASVMTGKHNVVVKLFKDLVPFMLPAHCVAHKLALAIAEANRTVKYLHEKFDMILITTWKFFEYSSNKAAEFVEIQRILFPGKRDRKIPTALHVRWLSHERTIEVVVDKYDALVLLFSLMKAKDKDAASLYGFYSSYSFIAYLLLFRDVVPLVADASRHFQSATLDLSKVPIEVKSLLDNIAIAQAKPGPFEATLGARLKTLESKGHAIRYDSRHGGLKQLYQKGRAQFLGALRDQVLRRFPDDILFGALVTLFAPASLPVDPVLAANLEHGEAEIQLLGEHFGKKTVVQDVPAPVARPLAAAAIDADSVDVEELDVVQVLPPIADYDHPHENKEPLPSDDDNKEDAGPDQDGFKGTPTRASVVDAKALPGEWAIARSRIVNLKSELAKLHKIPTYALTMSQLLPPFIAQAKEWTPQLWQLAVIAMSLPVSTVDCERGFSTMKRIKTRLRSSLRQETLDQLMRISELGPPQDQVDWSAVLKIWNSQRQRKLLV
jgi:hypothetical protein